MSETKGVHQDRLKVRFSRPKGKITRRELLKLVLPHYEVIPFIEPVLCRGNRECELCLDSCPLKAIKVEADEIVIDTALCSGCGACLVACPHRAIIYPTFSLEQLDKEMGELLLSDDTILEPRIMALVCQNCLPASSESRADQLTYPSNVVSLKIPCLAMASPWLMLRAFDRGAQGLALISKWRECPVGFDSNRWQENIRFVQGLLSCWHIESERIRAIDIVEDAPLNVEQELDQFAQEIAGLGSTPLRVSEPTLVPDDGFLLPELIKGLGNKVGGLSKGTVTAGMVPFGKLELAGSQCTGCGLCALDCPTEALTASLSEETDGYLLFRHDLCVACGRCIAVCPEQCLRLERILELDKIDSPAVVLFEDRVARCRECGNIIGTRAMIERLRVKLLAASEPLISQLELCPTCKIRTQFNLGRATPGPAAKPD